MESCRLIRGPPPRLAVSLLRHGMPFRRDKHLTPLQRPGTECYDDDSTRNNTRPPTLLYTLLSLEESWRCNIDSFPGEPSSLRKLPDMRKCHDLRGDCSLPSPDCNNSSPFCNSDESLRDKTSFHCDDIRCRSGTGTLRCDEGGRDRDRGWSRCSKHRRRCAQGKSRAGIDLPRRHKFNSLP